MEPRAVIAALLHELELPDQALSLLVAHAEAVARDADRLGLVSERSLDEILVRHTADSLLVALARAPRPGEAWIDVGSGAGFPGLPLACAYPDVLFTLLEPQQRRMGFLELQVLNLGLGNVTVSRSRLQSVPPSSADVVVSRALEQPEKTFPLLTAPLRPGGVALLVAAPGTPSPPGAEEIDVRRAFVDSPGVVLMMHAAP
jgi:16S rRNA (guanine527-N7)-methyltransferase